MERFRKELILYPVTIIVSSIVYFLVFILPTYNRIGWYYPFGWDIVHYVCVAKLILTYGYGKLFFTTYYPSLYPLLLASLSKLFNVEPTLTGIWLPLILVFTLAVAYLVISKILYGNHLYAFTTFFITLFSPATMRLLSGLHRNLLFLIEFSLFIYVILRIKENPTKLNLLLLGLLVIVCWGTWPPCLLYFLLILLAGLILMRRRFLKVGMVIIAAFAADLTWRTININALPLLVKALMLSRPQFTLDTFILYSGNTPLHAALTVLGSFILLYIGFINRRFLPFSLGLISVSFIIAILLSPVVEIKYRLLYTLHHGIVISAVPYYISQMPQLRLELPGKHFTIPRRTLRFTATLLCIVIVIVSFIGAIYAYTSDINTNLWIRWALSGDDGLFFQSLESLSKVHNSGSIYIFLVNDMSFINPHLLTYYIKSYIPNTTILYFNSSNLSINTLLESIHLNSSYPSSLWSYLTRGVCIRDISNSTIIEQGILVFQSNLFIDKYNILACSLKIDEGIYILPVSDLPL